MKNLLLTITIVLVAITSSWTQTTYYVNDNSTVGDILTTAVGNNANPGTAAAPFLTIAYAVSQAINGDIIIVDVGTYAETVTININVTIRGANFGVDPNTGTRVAESIVEDGGFQIPGANTVIIDGFQVFQTNTTTPVSLGGAAAATIQNCILERQGVAPGSPIRGIETSAGAGIKTIANNLFTGDVSGGLFGGHLTWNSGMYVNGAGSTIAITDNVFENCRTAINLDDFNANITISSNTFDNNGTHLSFGGASATSGSFTLGANEFKVPGSAIINLSNVTAAFRLDITAGTFNGTAFSALSLADLFNIEAGMYHRGRSSRNGLVYYVANNLYVRSDINANIQTAIDYAAANDVVNIQDGTYNQRLTVTKSLTLDGQSKAGTILDGTGLSGTGSGVALSNNVTDFTIKDLTVQNYAGSTPNTSGGIYAPSNNNNLTVDNVTIQNNTSAAGFYANGPIDNVSITNSMVNNHGPGARGIVIWNGLKTNITITDNMVSNNNCCGIELQDGDASAVNISDNTIDIGGGDNAIGIVGLNPSVGSNTINNNTITGGGRYGIEIKNPAGDVTVDGNNVSLNTQNADLRDRGGIIIMRRGVLGSNVDVPNGVTITGNTVVGYVQSNGGSSSEGFGIVVEGTNHTVTGNTVQNCDVGIIQQQNPSGYPGDADQSDVSDLFFGRGNSPITCGNTISGNSFMGNGLDERNVGLSGGLVENTNTGEFFCSIQAAIDDPETLDGHAITVGTGTYIEDVNVNKANLTISGADAATTIVSGPAGGDGGTFRVAASGVTIEGFTITREGNNTTDWNDPNLNFAGVAIQGQTNNATIRENIITGNRTGIDINNSNGNQIIDNNIDFNRTGLLFRNQTDNTVMTGNFITDNWTMGVLFLDASGGTNSPVQSAINSQFNNNNISGNWYGDIVERQEGGSLPTPGTTNLKNFECNWFGTSSPVVSTANSTEPGYATHIPVAYGGMATNPGGAPNILGPASANFEFIPWGTDGADSDPAASGWQITPGTCTGCPLSVTIDANPSGDLCLSTTVQYSVTVTGGTADPITYAWCAYNSGDGSGTCFNGFNDNTLPGPTRTWSASPGAKSVGVTITQGACVAEDLYVFNINSLPNTSVSQDLTEICPGGAVELTFTDNDVTGNSFDITADLVDDNGTTTGGFSASGVPSGAQVTYTEGTDFVAAPGNTASLTNILVTNTTTGCEQSLTDLTITVNPVPVLTFEVNGSAADANTDPDVQVCDEENVTVTSLVLGAEDDETVFNVNFDYTNIDPASFAPAGDNTLTGTALRAAFEDVAIPMSLTDDTDEGSLIVTVTPYYDVDGDGQIDMTDDCPGDPVTVTINVDPVPVLTFEVNGSAADANTDPDVQVCDEENVTVTSLVLGAEDDETVFNVNFDYTNIDPASFAPAGDNTLTGTALRAAFEDVAIPMSLTDDTDEGSLIVTVTPYYDVDGDGQIDMTDDCPGDPVTVTINVDPVPVLTFEVNGSAADANTDPDVQVCDEENVTVTSLVLGAEDDETVFNVNFDYTNIDPASFAPAGDNTLTGTALRAAFEDVAIPMSLTDDTDEGSLIVTVTPYYDVDGDGQIDMTDDCPGDPVTVTINVDPVPVLTFEVNGSAADANTDPDVQVCDEENVTVTSLVLGAEDDETVFNVNFDYTNIDPASFAPAGDNTLTGTALRAAFEDVAIPMSLTDDTDEGSLVVTVTPYYDVDGDGQIDMTDDCPGDPVTVTINVDPVPVLTFEVNGSAADANTDPDVQVCDEENVTVTSLVLGAEDDETVFNVNFDYTNIDPASFAPPGDNTLTGTALRAAFEDVAIPMSLTDDTDEGSLIITVTPYYDVDGDGQIDMTDDCPGDPVTVTINVDPVPVLTFEVNGSAADANTDPDVQVCDEENVTVTSLVLGAEDDETVFNVNFDYTNIDPASFAPPGDNTLTGTALRAAFEDVAIPMSLTDDTDEGSLIVTVTPYYDVDGDGQIDMTDDCPGDPVTVTINVDPVPVLTFEVNGSAADANTDPDVQVCDEENVTVTSLVLGAEDDETVFNVNFDYTNIDPASFAPPGDNTLTGTALRAAFEDVAIPMSLTDDTDEGSLIVTVTPYYDVDGDGQIDMTDDCPGDPVTVTINVDPVPVLTFEVNGSAADANTDPDVQVCDEENVTVTSLVLGAEDDETVFNVNFDYTNIDPASFAPAGDNTLTGTALRAAFEDVAIPMSLTDDTDEGSLIVTVTPYYDVDGDGQIDMTDDCPGDPVTVTINVDPVPVLTFEVNGSAADANTDPDVQVCDEENVTVTSLVLGAEDDETVFNVNFDYTNIDPASFAPAGDNTLTGTALRAAFEDVAIPMSLTDDTDEGSLIVTVTPYYDVDGDGQIDMTDDCPGDPVTVTINVDPVPVLTFEVNGSAADANTDPDVQVCDEENVTVTSLVLGAEDDETVFNVNFDYTNIDPASFAPPGDNTLTGTALRAAFEDVAIPMSLTDDTDEGSLIVTVTPYYDVDGDGQIDMTDDCPGDPVTVTINVDPVPVLTFEVNGSAADANTDPDVQVCDEENVTVTSLVLGAEDDETVFNVNFDYTNIDPASFAPPGDNTLTGTALRAAFEDVAIPMSLTDDTDEGSLIVTVTPYYDVDGDGQIDMTDDCPGDPVTVTINVDPVPVLTFEVNGSAADANTDPDVQVCDEENVTVTSLVLGAEDDETVFNVNFDYTNIDPASFAPPGDNTLTGTALRAAFEDVAIPMSLTDDTDEGSLIVTVTPYYDVDGDGQIDMTDDCPGDPVTVTINVDPVPVLTFEVNGSAADANTDPDVQVCDEENVTVTSLVLGAEDDETVFNVNFDYTNIDPASFAPPGDNTLTGTALRAAFEDVAIPMSLTDDTDEGSLIVTVTPYYDVDGDGQIDMTDDCPGDPVTVTINVDPVPVLTFEVNGSAADANTDPDVQVCDEENVTVTSLVLGAEDDETVFNVNFDYTNIDPASFAPAGDNTLTGTALRAAFEDVAIPMSLTDDTDEGSLVVTVTPYYDVDGDGQIDMTDDCPGDPVTVTINVDPVPELALELNDAPVGFNSSFEFCYDETITATFTGMVSGAAPIDLAWDVFIDGSTMADATLSGNETGLTVGTDLFSGTLAAGSYEVVVTSFTDANGCSPSSLAPYNFSFVVNPSPSITINRIQFDYCSGEELDYDIVNNGSNAVTFDLMWSNDPVANFPGTATDISYTGVNIPGNSTINSVTDLAPDPIANNTGSFDAARLSVSAMNIVDAVTGCVAADLPIEYGQGKNARIFPEPVLDDPVDATICSGEDAEIDVKLLNLPSVNPSTGAYPVEISWTVSTTTNDAGITGAAAGGPVVAYDAAGVEAAMADIIQTLSNVGSTNEVATYTISASSNNSCTWSSVAVEITVNPLPNTSVNQDLTVICPGGAVQLTFTDNNATGNSFDITADLVDDNGTATGGFSASGVSSGATVTYTEGVNFTTAIGNSASLINIVVTNTTTGCSQALSDLEVAVADNEDPVAICPTTAPTVILDGSGSGSLAADALAGGNSTDNCEVTETSPATSFDCTDVGTTTVVLTATDGVGNMNTANCTVTIEDNTAPMALCQDVTIELNANGQAVVEAEQVDDGSDDACGIAELSVAPNTFNCDEVGPNTVILTATDVNNNSSTCSSTVTVEDNLPPVAFCKNITIKLDANGNASIIPQDVNNGSADNCGIAGLELDNDSFGCEDVGNNTVILTVTDNNDNTGACAATITVVDDTPPTALCQDITIQLDENGQAAISADQIDNGSNDACGIDTLSVSPADFSCAEVGTNTVVLIATDTNDNSATCSATVTVQDTVPPTALCQDITIQLDESGQASITANQIDNGSNDACGIDTLVVSPTDFTCDEVGVNTVVLTATDNNDNIATCSATVTVQDTVPPVATCQDVTIQLDADGNGTITADQVDNGSDDACGIADLNVEPTSFSCDQVGPGNVVTLTVTDNNDNVNTCTASVTVEDTVAPDAICQDVTVYLDENGNGSISADEVDNGTDDACGIASIELDPVDFTCNDVGENTVTLTVFDNNGNSGNCTATAMALDTVPPAAECQDVTIQLDGNGEANISVGDINNGSNDACGISAFNLDLATFGCDDVGQNTVILEVTDLNKNTGTCEATVTVQDTTPPVASCQDITITLSSDAPQMTITPQEIDGGSSDVCGIDSLAIDLDSFGCEDQEDNVVTLTVWDVNGNSSSCAATVTVEDLFSVSAVCQDVTVTLDDNGQAMITPEQVDGGSAGGCGEATLSLDQTTFDCSQVGSNTVVLTVSSSGGSTSTCSATVEVLDDEEPEAVCQDITIYLSENGQTTIAPSMLDDGSIDNCGIVAESASETLFNCNDLGQNFIFYTIEDASGNEETCVSLVTVADTFPPVVSCKDITVDLGNNGQITLGDGAVVESATAVCQPIEFELSESTFDCDDIGPNTVTLTATSAGGESASCNATITVVDQTVPNIFCQNTTAYLDETGTVTIDPNDLNGGTTDGCGIASLTLDQNTFDCDDQGINVVTLTAVDNQGNQTSCTAFVGVLDTLGPTPNCLDLTICLDTLGMASISADQIYNGSSDNCSDETNTTFFLDQTDFDCSSIGDNTVTLIAQDELGNQRSCQSTVTVEDCELACDQPCPDSLEVNDVPIPSGFYQAAIFLSSTGTVDSGSTVTLQAGEEVVLLPGFDSKKGSITTIKIGDCEAAVAFEEEEEAEEYYNLYEEESRDENLSAPTLKCLPNPFRASASLQYTLPSDKERVRIWLADATGQRIRLLVDNGFHPAGMYSYTLDASDLVPGLYFIGLESEGVFLIEKIVIME